MRLAELFGPQIPTPKKKSADTVPEVFIIESLELHEEEGWREGAVLASVLKMCGKNPLYYYIRTKDELKLMARKFAKSAYRYLHISCHGSEDSLHTTLDPVDYSEFAEIFEDRLKNRRLFVSACNAGTKMFAKAVHSTNPDIISIAAPIQSIGFDHAVAFWSAFYVKSFSLNSQSMKSGRVAEVLEPLAHLFGEPVHFSWKGKNGSLIHKIIDGEVS